MRLPLIDAFPWPAQEGFLDQFSGDGNIRAVAASGFGFEALWFNHDSPPLDNLKVREALMYAMDRQAVRLFPALNGSDVAPEIGGDLFP